MKILKSLIPAKILCVFYGGSLAYGFQGSDSDIDYMVIVDDELGFRLVRFEEDNIKHECFVFGKKAFQNVQEISEDSSIFTASHADNILACKDPNKIIFLDEEFQEEFLALVNKVWDKNKVKKFLFRFVDYYKLTLDLGVNIKKYYHIYRMKAMVEHYELTGNFDLIYPDPHGSFAKKYKEHYPVLPKVNEEVKRLLNEINSFIERIGGI